MDPLCDEIAEADVANEEAIALLAELAAKLEAAGGRLRARGRPLGWEFQSREHRVRWLRMELLSVRKWLAPHAAQVRSECETV